MDKVLDSSDCPICGQDWAQLERLALAAQDAGHRLVLDQQQKLAHLVLCAYTRTIAGMAGL